MGVPASYVAGTTYPFTVCISDDSKLAAGFRVVKSPDLNTASGNFTLGVGTRFFGSSTQTTTISHNTPLALSGSAESCWNFDWTAPASGAGDVSFFANGNAVNLANGNGGDNGGYNVPTVTVSESALPIELASFEVSEDNLNALIQWTTASESGNEYFEVERSMNGKDFEPIAKIAGAGDSNETIAYRFMDESPLYNLPTYYRLKQVDFDGQFEYSPAKTILIKQDFVQIEKAYPNPIALGNELSIPVNVNQETEATLTLVNILGQELYKTTVNLDLGNSLLTIPTFGLPANQYFVKIENGFQVISSEVVVLK